MTKEELYSECVKGLSVKEREVISDAIEEFFSQNVVIPKGENRHPYADVLHEWIEGVKIQQNYDGNKWIDMDCVHDLFIAIEARIKPSEPVYEYYYVRSSFGANCNNSASPAGYKTEEEAEKCSKEEGVHFYKVEETKRLRQ